MWFLPYGRLRPLESICSNISTKPEAAAESCTWLVVIFKIFLHKFGSRTQTASCTSSRRKKAIPSRKAPRLDNWRTNIRTMSSRNSSAVRIYYFLKPKLITFEIFSRSKGLRSLAQGQGHRRGQVRLAAQGLADDLRQQGEADVGAVQGDGAQLWR